MIYNHKKRSLYSDDKRLIRKFDCPLKKQWDRLSSTGADHVRYCGSCEKKVLDISPFSEEQMIAVFKTTPNQCAYLNFEETTAHIAIEGKEDGTTKCAMEINLPCIQTARGLTAINEAIRNGNRVDIRETDIEGAVTATNWCQSDKDGFISLSTMMPELELEIPPILSMRTSYREKTEYDRTPTLPRFVTHPQGYLESPLSAYIVPHDISPNTQVHISDVIEHVPIRNRHGFANQKTATARWDGNKIVLDTPKTKRVIEVG